MFGARVAAMLRPGDVILLSGPIGAGKTHFARSVIQARLAEYDAVEDVPSPTFTLVQTYLAGPVEVWHADLYRLTGPADVLELGLDVAFSNAICIVEWPERLGDLRPENHMSLTFAPAASDDARNVTLVVNGAQWITRFATLCDTTNE